VGGALAAPRTWDEGARSWGEPTPVRAQVMQCSAELIDRARAWSRRQESQVDTRYASLPKTYSFASAGSSRLGAFEVYMVTSLGDDGKAYPPVPRCTLLHSKLSTRHFPRAANIVKAAQEVISPYFHLQLAKQEEDERQRRPAPVAEVEDCDTLLRLAVNGLTGGAVAERQSLTEWLTALGSKDAQRPTAAESEQLVSKYAPQIARVRHGASPAVAAEADAALRAHTDDLPVLRAIGLSDVALLEREVARHRWASPSVQAEAEAKLHELRDAPRAETEADLGVKALLAHRPLEASALRRAKERHTGLGASVLEELGATLRRVETADEAIQLAMYDGATPILLRCVVQEHQANASGSILTLAEAHLAQLSNSS
jgi:hypothetical protein